MQKNSKPMKFTPIACKQATPVASHRGRMARNARTTSEEPVRVRNAAKQAGIVRERPASEYSCPGPLTMRGATAPDGKPWIHVIPTNYINLTDGKGVPYERPGVWIRLDDFAEEGSASLAKRRLRAANIHLFGNDQKLAIADARAVRDFPPLTLIERVGWTGGHFAIPSGEVFSTRDAEPAVVLFEKDQFRCARKGDKTWLHEVRRLAVGQAIITFILALPFAAPLLADSPVTFNPGCELTGPKRKGKSTLQQLAASIIGVGIARDGRSYIVPANTTTNALEELALDHADLLMIIEEMAMYYASESPTVRQRKMLELIMRLASGTVKSRRGEPTQRPARFVYLSSSNEPLSSLFASGATQTSSAASDRLLTIPVSAERPYGIFDSLPKGCSSSKEAIRAIADLVENHHGQPMRVFLRKLVATRADDEAMLQARIEALIKRFRDEVGVDDNVGSESSVADVFGLVYAAGKLAQEYGALPKELSLLRSVVKVYRLNREISGPMPSNLDRLRALAERKGVIRINPGNLKRISDKELDRAPALLRIDRNGSTLLMLTDAALRRAFPIASGLWKDPEVSALIRKDAGRKKYTVSVRTNEKQDRMYAFALIAVPKTG